MTPLGRLVAHAATVVCLVAGAGHSAGSAALTFARQLETALNARDTAFVDSHFVFRSRAIVPAVDTNTSRPLSLGALIFSDQMATAKFTLIRMSPSNAPRFVAWFRAQGEHTVTYVAVDFATHDTAAVIIDWRNLLTGAYMSDIAALWSRAADSTAGSGAREIAALLACIASDEPRLAHRTYMALPESLAIAPIAVAARLKATQLDGATRAETSWFYTWLNARGYRARAYPLIMYDWFLRQGHYRRALASVRQIEAVVGSDAALTDMRAAVFASRGKTRMAYRAFADAIESDPNFDLAYRHALNYLVRNRQFSAAVEALDVLAVRFGYDFDVEAIGATPGYEQFAKSPEFLKWVDAPAR